MHKYVSANGQDIFGLSTVMLPLFLPSENIIPALAGFQRVHRLGDFIMSVTPSSSPRTPIQNASDLGGLGCF